MTLKSTLVPLLILIAPSLSLANIMTLTCGDEFIQVYDTNGMIDEVRVNDQPTKLVIASHKVNVNNNVDTYFLYGYPNNQTVTRLYNSGNTKITTHQKFKLRENGTPENPGDPVTNPISCK
ncbi:TPA: hypothetical protein ACS787_000183 [Providencia alcalifaciens]|uniref:hypothetical protein n=1 Tax=Providencia alcalifaciens TaxID=126385 RepID=UPI000568091D|nr:hypothetical protein [Providencia alcalifaciens]